MIRVSTARRLASFSALLLVPAACAVDTRELTVTTGTSSSSTSTKGESGTDTESESGTDTESESGTDTESESGTDTESESGTDTASGTSSSNSSSSGSGTESSGTDPTSDPTSDPTGDPPLDGPVVVYDIYENPTSWIDGSTNDVGIQGGFFVLQDSILPDGTYPDDGLLHTSLSPSSLYYYYYDEYYQEGIPTSLPPCVYGTLGAVTNRDGGACVPGDETPEYSCYWDAVWGGGISVHLNETGGQNTSIMAYDAPAHGVSGFEIGLSGYTERTLRIDFVLANDDTIYCINVRDSNYGGPTYFDQNDKLRFDFADVRAECWAADASRGNFDPSQLEQIRVAFPTVVNESFDVDLCWEHLAVY